jgi:hypothetical protein
VKVDDLRQSYKNYYKDSPETPDAPLSQRPYVAELLSRYSFIYFIGIGLPPAPPDLPRMQHGIKFFNEKLLPAVYQKQTVPPDAQLKKIGKDVLQCTTGQSEMSGPVIRPAVWQYSMPQPHLRYVSSTENCTSPVAMGSSRT